MISILALVLTTAFAKAPDFPNPEVLKSWQDNSVGKPIALPTSSQQLPLNCANKMLVPTHAAQTLKEYHVNEYAQYDHFKLPGDSYACLIAGKTPNRYGVLPCFNATVAHHMILSDTYQDACGNKYRGYWDLKFLAKDENMGTLFSLGRTMFPREGSKSEYDMVDGFTYEVPVENFLFLGPLLPGDLDKIRP